LAHTQPSLPRALRVLLGCGVLWVAPIGVLALAFGRSSVFVDEARLFSQAAVVTFGGAYAVLAYIAQQAVEAYGWLQPGEMLDGLGLAETTPGPLIMVVQFVGFLGAYRDPHGLSPLLAGMLGSAITVWVTFVPCFLWIFLGAPYIEALRGNRALHAGLSAITAAVVGVIMNLSVWFAMHVLFGVVHERYVGHMRLLWPDLTTVDVPALVLAALAMIAMLRFKVGVLTTLAVSAALGVGVKLLG
ncbi:MAG TPA: chromate transporter, partial [Polyangiales bacterium]